MGRRVPSITLLAYEAWVIRSTTLDGNVRYAESYKQWNTSPAFATIFRDWDAAHQALWAFNKIMPPIDGEVFDVVPLWGALSKAKV